VLDTKCGEILRQLEFIKQKAPWWVRAKKKPSNYIFNYSNKFRNCYIMTESGLIMNIYEAVLCSEENILLDLLFIYLISYILLEIMPSK
jgi:hypothetical protein